MEKQLKLSLAILREEYTYLRSWEKLLNDTGNFKTGHSNTALIPTHIKERAEFIYIHLLPYYGNNGKEMELNEKMINEENIWCREN